MKNKKIIIVLLIALVLLGGIFVVNFIMQKNNKTVADTTQTGSFRNQWGKDEIIVGLDQEYPPITFRNDKGELVGFDIDLAKEAFKRMGLTPVFKPMDWSTIVLSLTKKDIDVVWSGMTITTERQDKINFTDAYFKGPYVYILKPDSQIKTKEDLAGKKVGVQAGSSNEDAFKKDPIYSKVAELKSYSTFQESLLDLDIGRIDTVYGDSVFAYYYINSKGMNYKVIEEANTEQGAGVGIRKEDTSLLTELNRVLNEMKQYVTAATISNTWFRKNMFVI